MLDSPPAGDIDIVMGGPPCQGVSGLNRHAVKIDIRDDSRSESYTAFTHMSARMPRTILAMYEADYWLHLL